MTRRKKKSEKNLVYMCLCQKRVSVINKEETKKIKE